MKLFKVSVAAGAVLAGCLAVFAGGCGDDPGCGTLACSNAKSLSNGGPGGHGGRDASGGMGGNSASTSTGGGVGNPDPDPDSRAGAGGSSAGGGTTTIGGATSGDAGRTPSACGFDGKEVSVAVHVALDVTWPSTLGTAGGAGKFHVWSLNKMTPAGNAVAGTYRSCGTSIPETTLAAITGGGKLLVEVPMSLWDQDPPLAFKVQATLSAGWAANSSIVSEGEPAVIGLTMPNSTDAWPASYANTTPADVDKDGKPGMTAIPKGESGYVNPPLSIMGPLGPRADQVYLASRTQVKLEGLFTSCTEHSGNATPVFLDTHVVGCHVARGAECTATQAKFADDNRMVFVPQGGTYKAKVVADSASCADVRATLPVE